MQRISKRLLLILLFLVFSAAVTTFATSENTPKDRIGHRSFNGMAVNHDLLTCLLSRNSISAGLDQVIFSEDMAAVISLYGQLSPELEGNIINACKDFLLENSEIFNLPDKRFAWSIETENSTKNGNAWHIGLQLLINGLEVKDAIINFHVGLENRINLITGAFPDIYEIQNKVVLTKDEAIEQLVKAINGKGFRAPSEATLIVFTDKSSKSSKICFRVKIATRQPLGDWEGMIDAGSGEVLEVKDLMLYATGQGSVFPQSPIHSSLTTVDLPYLLNHTMEGEFIRIINEDAVLSSNENDQHFYSPDNIHFAEVNMYYFLNRAHDFFKNLGHQALDRQIPAFVHYSKDFDNCFFSPMEMIFGFGDGKKFNNLALDSSMAYHEYAHAVMYTIKNTAYHSESGAMNEGQADYFACSINNNPLVGEYICANLPDKYLRKIDNNLHYPEDLTGEVHTDGLIWGGMLWDIRTAIGQKDADLLIYQSHFYLNALSPKFIDGFNGLIAADKNSFNGRYKTELETLFQKRGIVPDAYMGQVLTKKELSEIAKFNRMH